MASKRQIDVGGVKIGGGAPVAVQSMTKTETADFDATMKLKRKPILEKYAAQIEELYA